MIAHPASAPPSILVIEDDRDIAELLQLHLRDQHYQVQLASNGRDGWQMLAQQSFDLLLLDLRLPDMDGLDICQRLRRQGSAMPVLMLTAKSSELDRVLGLEIGADDYLCKPFSIMELCARVKALFRREQMRQPAPGSPSVPLHHGDLSLDPVCHQVTLGSKRTELTAREFDLLKHFMTHPGRAAEELPYIFDRFFRGKQERDDDNEACTGLGLTIAKRIIDLHNSELAVSTEPQKGSAFRFALPAA